MTGTGKCDWELKAGVVKKVATSQEHFKPSGSVYYNPHRELVNQDQNTTKLSVVYDASSKRSSESSLNDC